ncbi:MAG: hypothetical protein M1823_003738 [Watsoniomyces obsoletus]|nr:MAG: hypothetical protein M1823_003738 [Watsoniomyces obsoletus]
MADTMFHHLHTWSSNLQHNLSDSVTRMTIQDYLRLVIIVGGYALLRPYLIQLGGRFQAKDHERELSEHETSSMAAMSPNSLRGQVSVPEDTDDEDDEEGETSGAVKTNDADWGRRARRRQREMIRKLLEAEERARAEEDEDSDKEIEEYLVKG